MPHRTEKILRLLRQFESRNVTFLDPDGTWPIVWERAQGNFVWDSRGRKYVDLTAAFGVAACGHANRRVVRAGQRQMSKLLHAMGDVHPHPLKGELARELSSVTFERWSLEKPRVSDSPRGKVIFCNSGFEAVEAALKTALLATGKSGLVAFQGAYHGLGYGALNATHRDHFRTPFVPQLGGFARFVAFPATLDELKLVEARILTLLRNQPVGAILVEPVQTRGGINVPPARFMPALRKICDRTGTLLILDEIYTGFGRTGKWFACDHAGVVPDMICLGKALTGGFPLSACVGRADLMDKAWPLSSGEAIHTSTFLGHPVGCAMALAQLKELRARRLLDRAACLGEELREMLQSLHVPAGFRLLHRGVGLLAGVEIRRRDGKPATDAVIRIIKAMLRRGFILLPEGAHSNVIAFSPPLTITKSQLKQAALELQTLLETVLKSD